MSWPAYPSYKPSAVEHLGGIPSNWAIVPLKRLAIICNGRDYKEVEDPDGEYPVIGSGGEFARASAYLYSKPSVLFGRKGTVDRPLYEERPFWTVDTMFYTNVREGVVPKFLYYLASIIPFERLSTNTALPSVAQEDLAAISLPRPAYGEQCAIVAFLDYETARIDALIEEQQRLIWLLQEKRQSIISQAVIEGVDPDAARSESGIEWLGEVPSHWRVMPVRALAKRSGPAFTDGDWVEAPYITDDGVRLIQTGNVGVGRFREQGFRFISPETFETLKCTEVQPGDLLICRLADPVGRACLAPDLGCRMITSVDVCIIKLRDGVVGRYIIHLMSSKPYLDFMRSVCRGGTRDRVSRSFLGSVRIPLPDFREQKRIVDYLDNKISEMDALEAEADRAIGLLRERRSALISAAVTGKIDVRDWSPQNTVEEQELPMVAEPEAPYG